ncbi:beta-galactosidase isoform X2 [Wolffia australiana]
MGNLLNKEPPPPLVLVPPIFDFPPLAARTRMLVPAYDLLFGKLALQCLFEDYMEDARNFSMRIMLKPLEDPHVDLAATISGPLNERKDISAVFHWQRELEDPNSFAEVFVSTSEPFFQIKSCVYHPKLGLGIFGFLPCSTKRRTCSENSGFIGMRYGSEKLSVGASFDPFPLSFGFPGCAWVVGRTGRLCAGVLYKPPGISKGRMSIWEPKNWNWAVSYVVGSGSPLSPSFSFALELAANSEVKNPFEANQIVGITNYVDFGIELKTRIDDYKPTVGDYRPSFQMAASWQANKNILIKGKIGSSLSSLALAFKSWWKPSFTFSITAVNNLSGGGTSFGFGIRIEDLREPRYERADPNYVMLTPTKEHLAEGVLREFGTQPMFQSNVESGNFEGLPTELKPMWKII